MNHFGRFAYLTAILWQLLCSSFCTRLFSDGRDKQTNLLNVSFSNETLTQATTSLSPIPINCTNLSKILKDVPENDRQLSNVRQYGPLPPVVYPPTFITFQVTVFIRVVVVMFLLVAIATIATIATSIAVPLGISRETSVDRIDLTIMSNCPSLPTNFLDRPGVPTPPDGCSSSSVLFEDQRCYPLLTPCQDANSWTTVNPVTLTGSCKQRLCGRERIFCPCDGLCHHIYDRTVASGGKRLYYNAFGDPVADCPIGQYPFPRPADSCAAIFTQGPCPPGQVVSVLENGLGCAPAQCPPFAQVEPDIPLQPVPWQDGRCYVLGSRGPCRGPSELLGYDVFERRAVCHDVANPLSPYFESQLGNSVIDQIFNQVSADFDDFPIAFVNDNALLAKRTLNETDRQDPVTFGVISSAGRAPTTLLTPCRPGSVERKCTNPLVPNLRRKEVLQAVKAKFG